MGCLNTPVVSWLAGVAASLLYTYMQLQTIYCSSIVDCEFKQVVDESVSDFWYCQLPVL